MGVTNFDQIQLGKETAIASANSAVTAVADGAVAVGASPTKAEFDAVVALANDLKAKHNASVTLINELKTKLNTIFKG